MRRYSKKAIFAVQLLFYIVINFFSLSCIAQNKEKINSGFNNVLTSGEVQSAAFHVFDKELYSAYVTRGSASSTLWVNNITKKTSWNLGLEINGVWELTGHNNGFVLAGEDGNLHFVDLNTKKKEIIKSPFKNEKPIVSIASEGNIVYAGTYKHALVFAYDTKARKYILEHNEPYFTGESYVRSMVYSKKNQSLYLGTGTKAILGSLDLATKEVKNLFLGSEKGYNFVYGMRLLEDINGNDYIFCRLTGDGVRKSMLFNISTNKFSEIFEAVDIASVIKGNGNQIFFSRSSTIYTAEIGNNKIINEKAVGKTQGAIIASYLFNNKIYYINGKGVILSFDADTYKIENQLLKFDKKERSEVVKLHTLYFDPDGFLWTSGFKTGTNAMINVKSGNKEVLKGLDQSEVIFSKGNKLYFGEYPDAKLYVYEKTKEWDKNSGNPKLIGQIIGQDRIVAATASDDLRKVFFGTVPKYGKLGGSLIIVTTDDKVEEVKPYKDLSIVSIVAKDKLVYGGTSISGGLGSKPTAKEGKLFVFDPSKKKVIFDTVPVKEEIAITALTELDNKRIVGMAGGTLFVFNTSTKEVEKRIKVYNAPSKTDLTTDASLIPVDNRIYLSGRKAIYCVDLFNDKIKKLRASGTHLTFDRKGTFYYLEGGDIRTFKIDEYD